MPLSDRNRTAPTLPRWNSYMMQMLDIPGKWLHWQGFILPRLYVTLTYFALLYRPHMYKNKDLLMLLRPKSKKTVI